MNLKSIYFIYIQHKTHSKSLMNKMPKQIQKKTFPDITRPHWIEINIDALKHNITTIRSIIPSNTKILLPVKADSYGHGSLAIAYAAKNFGVDFLGVAHLNEGILLRQYGVTLDILILGPSIVQDFPWIIEYGLTPTIADIHTAIALDEYLKKTNKTSKIHLKIDSGMHRYGIKHDDIHSILKVLSLKNLSVEGIFTHFATADEPKNPNHQKQITRFQSLLNTLESLNKRPPICHAANSASLLLEPSTHFDMVRPGLALYGYNPFENISLPVDLKPLMSIKSTIRALHMVQAGEGISYGHHYTAQAPMQIATIAMGYGDGYLRGEPNQGQVYIQGKACPIIGRVCMDATMVDVSLLKNVQIGEKVEVINGSVNKKISMENVAKEHHTIPYELTCRVARRLYRQYIWKQKTISWEELKEELEIPNLNH